MRITLLAALLALPSAAVAARSKAEKTKPTETQRVLTPPLYPPTTGEITIELVSARFTELDEKLLTLRANLRQFVRLDGSDTLQQVEGEILFKKPDLMRLTHRLPEKRTVVSDGTWLWVHDGATNQVIQSNLADWRKSEPLARGLLDFGHSADLLKRYAAVVSTVSARGSDGHRTFTVTLTPTLLDRRAKSEGFELTLTASTRDYFPAEMTLRAGHASIHSLLENVQINPALQDSSFHFKPPSGADVLHAPVP